MLVPRVGYGDLVWRNVMRLLADLAVADLTYQEVGATGDTPYRPATDTYTVTSS
jgi:hypothetical protein